MGQTLTRIIDRDDITRADLLLLWQQIIPWSAVDPWTLRVEILLWEVCGLYGGSGEFQGKKWCLANLPVTAAEVDEALGEVLRSHNDGWLLAQLLDTDAQLEDAGSTFEDSVRRACNTARNADPVQRRLLLEAFRKAAPVHDTYWNLVEAHLESTILLEFGVALAATADTATVHDAVLVAASALPWSQEAPVGAS